MTKLRGLWLALPALALTLSACGASEPAPGGFPGLLVTDSNAYLASNTHVYKLSLDTAAEQWRFSLGSPATVVFAGAPVRFDKTIVVAGGIGTGFIDNHVYAISDADGSEVWRFNGGEASREYVDGVATDGKLIYAANGDGTLYALDPATLSDVNDAGVARKSPTLVWKFSTGNRLWSRPLIDGGHVYQASMDHKLYALDAATGALLWTFDLAGTPIGVRPAIGNGTLYFGAFNSTFYAVEAATGKVKWQQKLESWLWSDPLLDNGVVYAGDVQGRVFALKADTGEKLWWFQIRDAVRAQPVVDRGTLFVAGMDTQVYALDLANLKPGADGRVEYKDSSRKWKDDVNLGRRMPSTPVARANQLWTPLFDGDIKLHVLDQTTGAKLLSFQPAK